MRKLILVILATLFSCSSFINTNVTLKVNETYKIAYVYDLKTSMCFVVLAYNVKTDVHYSIAPIPCEDEVMDEVQRTRYTISDFTNK